MAHYKRKRPRTAGCGYYSGNGLKNRLDELGVAPRDRRRWSRGYPRWWDKMFHTRPSRSRTKMLEKKVLRDADPDNMVWPDGRKPHIYYW